MSPGMGWLGRCLWIRVNRNINKPLDKGRALSINGKSIWVNFKYEKLPQFCYYYGRILHARQRCKDKQNFWLNDEEPMKQRGEASQLHVLDWNFEHEATHGTNMNKVGLCRSVWYGTRREERWTCSIVEGRMWSWDLQFLLSTYKHYNKGWRWKSLLETNRFLWPSCECKKGINLGNS
jgi:hypothetical protein